MIGTLCSYEMLLLGQKSYKIPINMNEYNGKGNKNFEWEFQYGGFFVFEYFQLIYKIPFIYSSFHLEMDLIKNIFQYLIFVVAASFYAINHSKISMLSTLQITILLDFF